MVERRLEPACVRVRLELLGGFGARDEAGRELAIGSRKAQALLAFLELSPGNPQPREKLTNLLWSDRGDAQARSSLRQALSELRQALPESAPPILRTQRDAVWLEAGAVEVDAVTLEHLIDGAEPGALSEAVALYRGDFLDGVEVRDAAFEEWRLDDLEAEKAQLETEIQTTGPPGLMHHPKLADIYAEKEAKLEEALNDPNIKTEASENLHSLTDKIELAPRPEGNRLDARLYGDLAQILLFCDEGEHKRKLPGTPVPGSQLSLVVGTRNQFFYLLFEVRGLRANKPRPMRWYCWPAAARSDP